MATKQFNPLEYGATPVQDGFDPLKLGAIPVETTPVQNGQPDDLLNNPVTRGIQSFFPGKRVGEAIGTLAGYGISKLKGTDKFYDTSAPSPLQVGGDILKGAAMIGGAKLPLTPTLAGKAAQFGTVGAATGAGETAAQGGDAKEIAKSALVGGAIGAGTGVAFGVAEKGFKVLGNLLTRGGEKIQTSIIKPTSADIKEGFDIKLINKYKLGGSLKQTFEKTDKLLDSLTKQLNSKISTQGAPPVNLNEVFQNTIKRTSGSKLSTFGSNTSMNNALKQLQDEVTNIVDDTGMIDLQGAQIVKRAAGHFGAWQYGMFDPDSTARQQVYNVFYNELKQTIEKTAPTGVKEINKQISELIPVMNALIRRIPVAERNSTISLFDIITLTAAAFEPRTLGLTIASWLSRSGAVGAGLAQFGGKIGKGVATGIEKLETPAKMFLPGFTNQLAK